MGGNGRSVGPCLIRISRPQLNPCLVTGCIRPETVDRLNPRDAGGQYDSSGGAGGRGNPQGSACVG